MAQPETWVPSRGKQGAKPKTTRGRNALSGVDLRALFIPLRGLVGGFEVITCEGICRDKQESDRKVKLGGSTWGNGPA
ncbi:hypothetical protein AOX55_00003645 [Sinorhizobium fredii CCBAU 25509]|nr:hypothetical protein AOX55_00003645 [Sinorhizobium fredii CCBAU 25509]